MAPSLIDMANGGASGGGSSSGNEVQSVQNSNQKLLNDLAKTGNAGTFAKAKKVASHNAGGGWFHDVLNALDLPRAAAVSGVDTLAKGGGFNQWLKGTEGHMTAGHVLNDLGIHNHLIDSIGGIVGDVALDPLTYVGGLGEVAKAADVTGHVVEGVNAARKAEEAAQTAAKVAEGVQAGTHTPEDLQAATEALRGATKEAAAKTGGGVINGDTVARLQTRGVAGLTPEERGVLSNLTGKNIDTGIGVRVPGSKLVGAPKMIKLAPSSVTDPIAGAVHEAATKLAAGRVGTQLTKTFGRNGGVLRAAAREAALSGDGERAAALTGITRLMGTAAGTGREVANEAGRAAHSALKQIPDEVVQHVPAAIEGNPEAIAAIHNAGGAEGLQGIQDMLAKLHERAKAEGMPIGHIENFFPHQLTDAAHEVLSAGGNKFRNKSAFASALKKRGLVAGAPFLGRTLETGSLDEINRIAREVYGEDALDVFNTNPKQVLQRYIHGMSNAIGHAHFLNELDKQGITSSGDLAMAPEDWAKLGETGHNAPQHIKDALQLLAESQSHKAAGPIGKKFDAMMNIWKQVALSSPGKAMRHAVVGPMWGSYLGNVGTSSLRKAATEWRPYQKALKASGYDVEKALSTLEKGGMDPKAVAALRSSVTHGIYHGHEFDERNLTRSGVKAAAHKYNPAGRYMRSNQAAQQAGQDYWRYAMFRDALHNKGMTEAGAAQKVRMYLGDPHAISNVERTTLRRIVPFYTFLRQNVPVELKALATNPGKFVNAVEAPSEEISQWSPQGQTPIPQLFQQTGGIPLPFKVGGNTVFLSPDLPFSRFSEMAGNPNQIAANLAPEIQAGIEALTHSNPYYGTQDSPYGKPMSKAEIPQVLGPILHELFPGSVYQTQKASTDFGVTTPKGTWEMLPEAADILGNLNPMMASANGLPGVGAPSKSGQGLTSLLDQFIGGAVLRTNTPQQQTGELLRRQAILKKMIEEQQNLGNLPRYIYGFKP